MKASFFTQYGPPEVLQLREVAAPVHNDREVMIRVHAASVSFGDTLVRNFGAVSPRQFHMPWLFWLIGRLSFGFRVPRVNILGSEFAGEVHAVGCRVTRFKKGDPVFGFCGPRMGAYAEYLSMPEDGVMARKPANLTYEQAAASPYGAIMALNLLRKIGLRSGQRVLVVGASGGIGPAVVRLAKSLFGAEVAGVCGAARLPFVRSLGADLVIDYAREDFTDRAETYDVIIDIPGKSDFRRCRRVLHPRGRLVFVSFKLKQVLQMLWTSLASDQKVICALLPERQQDLVAVGALMEAGTLPASVDRVFPLEQACHAHRYAESGDRKGPVVISLTSLAPTS